MKVRVGFGLGTTAAAGLGAEKFFSIVDACEHGGWDSIWFSERIGADVPDPLAAMAAVAGRTRRLRFGPSVVVLPGRNPVLLAKELATIDVLSAGRLIVVFGLGSDFPSERDAFGVAARERAARTEEATMLIRRLWTEQVVDHEGRFATVHQLRLLPKPVQDPHPDVWFGSHSAAACRRVGRLGDGWLPSFVAPSEYAEKARLIREVASDAGRSIEEDHYGALVPYLPLGAGEEGERILELVAARRPDIDPRQVIVTGDEAELRARLELFVAAGASKFVVVPALPPRDWGDELGRLREKVALPLES